MELVQNVGIAGENIVPASSKGARYGYLGYWRLQYFAALPCIRPPGIRWRQEMIGAPSKGPERAYGAVHLYPMSGQHWQNGAFQIPSAHAETAQWRPHELESGRKQRLKPAFKNILGQKMRAQWGAVLIGIIAEWRCAPVVQVGANLGIAMIPHVGQGCQGCRIFKYGMGAEQCWRKAELPRQRLKFS